MTVLIIIALQYIVSAKAGWVNYVDGQVSVQMHQQAAVDMPIETGPRWPDQTCWPTVAIQAAMGTGSADTVPIS